MSHSSVHATPPQDDLTVSRPGQLLRFWFSPKHGWRAKSYDQRYPGCTRQQIHRVYTADDVSLPDLLRNPRNLHWLSDPEQAGVKALYIGQLGLAGGMPPSKRVMDQAKEELGAIAVQATEQGKMDDLRRALGQAQEGADFDGVYEQVFGKGSSEEADLSIFDLTVEEVKELPNYKEVVLVADSENRVVDAQEVNPVVMSPAELVGALYSPVESEKHQAACEVLKSKKYEAAYSKVLPLTAGLLYKRYVDGKDAEARGLHVFWRYALSGSRELVGIHQVVLNMRCMEACGADTKGTLGKLHKPILDDITSWVLAAWDVKTKSGLTPALLPVLEGVWDACPCVLSYGPLVKALTSQLRDWTKKCPEALRQTLSTLGRLAASTWPQAVEQVCVDFLIAMPEREKEQALRVLGTWCGVMTDPVAMERACSTLCEVCGDKDRYIRESACKALGVVLSSGKVGKNEVDEVVNTLSQACGDKEWDVRRSACEALGVVLSSEKVGKKEVDKVVKTLCEACGDEHEYVRCSACRTLNLVLSSRKVGKEELDKGVDALIQACGDKEWYVRISACKALGIVLSGEKVGKKEVDKGVNTLSQACGDKDRGVRRSACKALGLLLSDEKVGKKEVDKGVDTLCQACEDKEWYVRRSACEALGVVLASEKVGKKEVEKGVNTLCQGCGYWHSDVRRSACEALGVVLSGGKVGKHEMDKVVSALCEACGDWHIDVRRSALEVLGVVLSRDKVGKEELDKVINTLCQGCGDKDERVHRSAKEALGVVLSSDKVGKKELDKVINTLSQACGGDKKEVRYSACKALGVVLSSDKVGNQKLDKVVNTLCQACGDEDRNVRYSACKALGLMLSSGKVGKKEVERGVNTLFQACEDKVVYVRCSACEALGVVLSSGKVGKKEVEKGVNTLCGACGDKGEYYVRESACKALRIVLSNGEIGKKEVERGVDTLCEACGDKDEDVCRSAYDALVRLLCRGYGDESVLEQAFTTLAQNFGYGGVWDIPGPVYASLHALLFGTPIDAKLRAQGWRMLCEGCDQGSGTPRLAIESLSKVLLRVELSVKELEQGLLVLFRTCVDGAGNAQGIADHALVCLMDKHQGLLVGMLMGSDLTSHTLIEAMTSYNPCLLLPDQCDSEVSGRIKRSFSQERKGRGWPEALLSVEDLPSGVPSKEDKGIFMESDKLEE